MNEMIGYFFSKMKMSEEALVRINKVFKIQNKINRRLALCSMLTGVGFILVNAYIQEQNEKIKQLSDTIAKMQEPTEGCTGSTETEN